MIYNCDYIFGKNVVAFLHLNKIVYGKNYIAKLEYKGKLKKVYRGLFMNTVMIRICSW